MKILQILIIFVVGTWLLIACKNHRMISTMQSGQVTDVQFVHNLAPGTVVTAKSKEALLEVVRLTVVEDSMGNSTIFVGEESDENSRIYYTGIKDNELIFQLVPGGKVLSSDPAPRFICKIPANSQFISLWGSDMEVLEASAERIRCRVMPDAIRI
jgi:hypothetical protein